MSKSYEMWVQTKLIIIAFNKGMSGDRRWHHIILEIVYFEGYIDAMEDCGEISHERYQRLRKLIEGYRKKNNIRREEEKNVQSQDQ